MTQTAETECKFTDLLPPKHGHFNGITGFSALPPLHDNIMGGKRYKPYGIEFPNSSRLHVHEFQSNHWYDDSKRSQFYG